MVRDTVYARTWAVKSKSIGQIFPVERARSRHAAGAPYTAILRIDESPYAVVVVHRAHGTVVVRLLDHDQEQRVRQTYEIDERDPTRMTLEEVTFYQLGGPDRPAKHHFNRRGGPRSWDLTVSTGTGDLRHRPGRAPASWDEGLELPVPAFGAYEHLVRSPLIDPHEFVLDD